MTVLFVMSFLYKTGEVAKSDTPATIRQRFGNDSATIRRRFGNDSATIRREFARNILGWYIKEGP
jgi:hypothetical protein